MANPLIGNTISIAPRPLSLDSKPNTASKTADTFLKQSANLLPVYARQGLKAPFTTLANAQSQRIQIRTTEKNDDFFSSTWDEASEIASNTWDTLKLVNQEYALSQRALGGLKGVGGLAEAAIGAIGVVAPEPLTSIGGAVLVAHGSDVAASGFNEMWTGKPQETFTDKAVTATAKALGANDATAHSIGDGVDMGISLGSAGVGLLQGVPQSLLRVTPKISTIEFESVLGKNYLGVKEASQFLKNKKVPRSIRKQILESFDVRTLNVRKATNQEYGIRYYDNINAWEKGRYLFETFPASRQHLALKPEWNQMKYMKQFKIKAGSTILEGRASSIGVGVEGGQIQKYILDLNNLSELK